MILDDIQIGKFYFVKDINEESYQLTMIGERVEVPHHHQDLIFRVDGLSLPFARIQKLYQRGVDLSNDPPVVIDLRKYELEKVHMELFEGLVGQKPKVNLSSFFKF